jgi:hypothetical protein
MHPLAFAENGRVWVSVRSRPAGLRQARLAVALAKADANDAALPDQQNAR